MKGVCRMDLHDTLIDRLGSTFKMKARTKRFSSTLSVAMHRPHESGGPTLVIGIRSKGQKISMPCKCMCSKRVDEILHASCASHFSEVHESPLPRRNFYDTQHRSGMKSKC
jgi:hypothetical protein